MSGGYLVDTDVISETSRSAVVSRPELLAWMDENSERLFLSAITITELEAGIAAVSRRGARSKAARLRAWLNTTLHLYAKRVLSFDLAAARSAGTMWDRSRAKGTATGFPDVAIAATADVHGLTVLSRNVRHFTYLDVRVHDPFGRLPP